MDRRDGDDHVENLLEREVVADFVGVLCGDEERLAGDIDEVVSRSALLDDYCAQIGRDPASITRSIHLPVVPVVYDQPDVTREAIGRAIDTGFQHIVLGLPAPYPANVARWVSDELIAASAT